MGRQDFLIAPSNHVALAAIEAPQGLPNGALVLTGPEGSGKTHLCQIWAQQQGAQWLPAQAITDALPNLLAQTPPPALVIDDAHLICDRETSPQHAPAREEALFHLLNHYRSKAPILMSARQPARDWGIALPDLRTRMSALAHVTLDEPDETLLAAVLVKLFSDRQLLVNPPLIDYLLGRMERSLAEAGELVALLDTRAMQLKRPITRALAQEVLNTREIALSAEGSSHESS